MESQQTATTTNSALPISCSGCKGRLDETADGVVVSFGDGLWHVEWSVWLVGVDNDDERADVVDGFSSGYPTDAANHSAARLYRVAVRYSRPGQYPRTNDINSFRCAKCRSLMEQDTILLLLADGTPVCENCSYVCSQCGQAISDEAIVTGNDSYHADCFKCKACSTKIEELVFAKAAGGIYCMGCHNERVAKSRKHADSKRNRSIKRAGRSNGDSSASLNSPAHEHRRRERATDRERDRETRDDRGPLTHSPVASSTAITTPSGSSTKRHADESHPRAMSNSGEDANDPRVETASNQIPDTAPTLPAKGPSPDSSRQTLADSQHHRRYPSASTDPNVTSLAVRPLLTARSSSDGLRAQRQHDYITRSTSADSKLAAASGRLLDSDKLDTLPVLPTKSGQANPRLQFSHINSAPGASTESAGGGSGSAMVVHHGNVTGDESVSSGPLASKSQDDKKGYSSETEGTLRINLNLQPTTANNRANNRRSGFYGIGNLPPPSPPINGTFALGTEDADFSSNPTDRGTCNTQRPLSPLAHSPAKSAPRTPGLLTSAQASGSSGSEYDLADEVATDIRTQPLHIIPRQDPASPVPLAIPRSGGGGERSSAPSSPKSTPTVNSKVDPHRQSDHLNDPDILVFLDAVADPSALRRSSTGLALASTSLPYTDERNQHLMAVDAAAPSSNRSPGDIFTPEQILVNVSLNSTQEGRVRVTSSSANKSNIPSHALHASPIRKSSRNYAESQQDVETTSASPMASGLNTKSAGSLKRRKSTNVRTGFQGTDFSVEKRTKEAVEKVRESMRRSRSDSISVGASPVTSAAADMTLDVDLVESLLAELEQTKEQMKDLQRNYNAIRRASRSAFEGFSMAREEYDREVQARKAAEYQMILLKEQMKQQAGKLGAIGELQELQKQQEILQIRSNDLRTSVVGIEKQLSQIKAERDVALAEVEELASFPRTGDDASSAPERLSAVLDARLSTLKADYRADLESLTQERDALQREVGELKTTRNLLAQEGETLNKMNAELTVQHDTLTRSVEAIKAELLQAQDLSGRSAYSAVSASPSSVSVLPDATQVRANDGLAMSLPISALSSMSAYAAGDRTLQPFFGKQSLPMTPQQSIEDTSTIIAAEKISTAVPHAAVRKFKWGSKKGLERAAPAILAKPSAPIRGQQTVDKTPSRNHNFLPISILRPVRCEHCTDKMWGMGEHRCQTCGVYCHTKCLPLYHGHCSAVGASGTPKASISEDAQEPTAFSMFGNDLVAQCLTESRSVPFVVRACVDAVEAFGLDHEGIYRKSGGMGQTKLITACFDRGEAFDLQDEEKFNDISAVTSVLKNYFRQLPNPLFTFEFHQDFCAVPSITDPVQRLAQLENLMRRLPEQHLATMALLMLHLHRIHRASSINRMTPANLGVVFGPTLMRSPDPSQEWSQMHLKARVVELTIEHAANVFSKVSVVDAGS